MFWIFVLVCFVLGGVMVKFAPKNTTIVNVDEQMGSCDDEMDSMSRGLYDPTSVYYSIQHSDED